MEGLFTFNTDRHDFIIRSLAGINPGITFVSGVSYVDGELSFRALNDSRDVDDMVLDDKPYAFKIANRFREKKAPYEWVSEDDIPFFGVDEKNGSGKKDIFSETENRIIVLRTQNRTDHLYDIYFLRFRENLSNFGVSNIDRPLSTDHKTIIGNLLQQFLRHIVNSYDRDLAGFRNFSENVRSMTGKHEDDHRELLSLKENYGDSLVALCRSYIQELSAQYRKTFHLTEDALDKIRQYKGNLQTLKLVIADAASFVNQAFFDEEDLELKIHGWELNFNKFSHFTESQEDVVRMDTKESKAIILLDKLERAALEVQRQQQTLTSANVGGAFQTPITAPAISDALKKNRKKILKVLEQYPEKWSTIRHHFRPLKNITEPSTDQEEKALTS